MGPDPVGIGNASGGEWILFAGGAVITVALLVGIVVFWVMIHREDRRTREAERERSDRS